VLRNTSGVCVVRARKTGRATSRRTGLVGVAARVHPAEGTLAPQEVCVVVSCEEAAVATPFVCFHAVGVLRRPCVRSGEQELNLSGS